MRITIKRRLMISNVLIFIIPIISVLVMIVGISIVVFGYFDGFIAYPHELT